MCVVVRVCSDLVIHIYYIHNLCMRFAIAAAYTFISIIIFAIAHQTKISRNAMKCYYKYYYE